MFCVAIGLAFIVLMDDAKSHSSIPASTPKEFFNYSNELFSVDLPRDKEWKIESGGETSFRWVAAELHGVRIKFSSNLRGSIDSDTMEPNKTGNPDLDPVDRIHNNPDVIEVLKEVLGKNYRETKGVAFKNKVFQTRRSDFTVGDVKGIRCTYLGEPGRCFNFICSCPAPQWKTMKPVFEKCLTSFGAAKRKQPVK